ncbi:McrB family protein [Desulfonema limicola]|nr:AAA family ATPase [Desulfonema limicola]
MKEQILQLWKDWTKSLNQLYYKEEKEKCIKLIKDYACFYNAIDFIKKVQVHKGTGIDIQDFTGCQVFKIELKDENSELIYSFPAVINDDNVFARYEFYEEKDYYTSFITSGDGKKHVNGFIEVLYFNDVDDISFNPDDDDNKTLFKKEYRVLFDFINSFQGLFVASRLQTMFTNNHFHQWIELLKWFDDPKNSLPKMRYNYKESKILDNYKIWKFIGFYINNKIPLFSQEDTDIINWLLQIFSQNQDTLEKFNEKGSYKDEIDKIQSALEEFLQLIDINEDDQYEKIIFKDFEHEKKDDIEPLINEKFKILHFLDFAYNYLQKNKYRLNINELLISQKAVVLYGPPGTGKTHHAKEEAEYFITEYCKQIDYKDDKLLKEILIGKVQFHPSYNYEDFIEGIKPVGINEQGTPKFQLTNGIFKSFCKKAGVLEVWYAENIDGNENFEKVSLKKFIENTKDKLEKFYEILDEEQIIYWKPILEKFKEIYNKAQSEDNNSDEELNEGSVNKDEDYLNEIDINESIQSYLPPFFIIIDEINRAELSRVFGELMLCLEYRGVEGKISTPYSEIIKSLNEEEEVYKIVKFYNERGENYFFIPHNLYVIGTMNTIDRSVDSIDFALRRRFVWKEVPPNPYLLFILLNKLSKDMGIDFEIESIITLKKNFNDLNNYIKSSEFHLNKEYCIGHTYFLKILNYYNGKESLPDAQKKLWKNHLQSLLMEYGRGILSEDDLNEENKEGFLGKCKNIFYNN